MHMPECCSLPTPADGLISMPKIGLRREDEKRLLHLRHSPHTAKEQESWVMNAIARCDAALLIGLTWGMLRKSASRIGNEGNTSGSLHT